MKTIEDFLLYTELAIVQVQTLNEYYIFTRNPYWIPSTRARGILLWNKIRQTTTFKIKTTCFRRTYVKLYYFRTPKFILHTVRRKHKYLWKSTAVSVQFQFSFSELVWIETAKLHKIRNLSRDGAVLEIDLC